MFDCQREKHKGVTSKTCKTLKCLDKTFGISILFYKSFVQIYTSILLLQTIIKCLNKLMKFSNLGQYRKFVGFEVDSGSLKDYQFKVLILYA